MERQREQVAEACRDERGATATEYGLLVGFIALIIVVGVGTFGTKLDEYFTFLAGWIDGVI
jgi:pilus assembly protein Flp/PilA